MFDGKTILITGGTGSFGNAIVPILLQNYSLKKLIIYSRDEMKQWNMAMSYKDHANLRFFIGDIRDKERLSRALTEVDYVIHAAATKIVPTAEYNPFECIKTNIIGAMNLIDVCIDKGVKKVVALSTDKASSPINLYGATKLASDKLFVAGNVYSGANSTIFSIVRYGNVMGSRGSVIPHFISIPDGQEFPVTDKRMTRFMITLEDGIDLVLKAFEDSLGGEIYVKKIPSMNILDIARSVNSKAKIKIVGIRPGEKLHEQMISNEDSEFTFEYPDYYKILPSIYTESENRKKIKDGVKVSSGFTYTSDNNTEWLSIESLREWIEINFSKIGNI